MDNPPASFEDKFNAFLVLFDKKLSALEKDISDLKKIAGFHSKSNPESNSHSFDIYQNQSEPNLSVNEILGELISPASSITFKKGVGEINSPETSLNDSSIQINLFDGSNTKNLSPKFQINSINGSKFMDTPKSKSFPRENKENFNSPKTFFVKYQFSKVIKVASDIIVSILPATSIVAKFSYGLDRMMFHLLDELFHFYDLTP